ncbi:MAG: hypothetical protein LBU04_03920 [Christensenellaceae bacterium]|jgi:UDP-N-acetylglucosamine:LPS N-acetylglucosamine transferase|nr:hypothetical protein [Christensenellaceae bacterium]
MKNKRTTIVFTDEYNQENAQAIKDYLASDPNNLAIIIGESEFQSIISKLIKTRLFNEDGFVMRTAEKAKRKFQSFIIDRLPPQDIKFNPNNVAHAKAYNILIRYSPDLIVLNDASVMKDIIAARNKAMPDVPIVMVVTDYIVSHRIINKHINKFYVDNMAIKTTLVNNNIPENDVILSDFPINTEFDAEFDKQEFFTKYNFSHDKPTILVSVPHSENAGIREALDVLKDKREKFNVIVDCGKDRNILVYAREKGITAINEGQCSHPVYANADIVIGRPTPLSIAKTFYGEKLFFSLQPKTETEQRTVSYLDKKIIPVYNADSLISRLNDFIENQSAFDETRQEIIEHNAKRPRGVLFKSLDLLLDLYKTV